MSLEDMSLEDMSLEDEVRVVLADERRALSAPADVAAGIRRGITRRRNLRTAIGSAAGVLVVVLTVTVVMGMTGARLAGPDAGPSGSTGSPATDVVPWIDTPPPVESSTSATTVTAPACTGSDLSTTATYHDHLGISQTDAANVLVRNVGSGTCALTGRPGLRTAANGGYQPITTTPASRQSYMRAAVIAPGEAATVQLAKTIACNGGVGAIQTLDHLALSVVGTTIPIPGLVLSGTCPDVTVSPWFTVAAAPTDSYQGLRAQIMDVGAAVRGATMRYVVALTNTSTTAVTFATCPGYTESIWKAQASYQLNCPAAMQPGQTVRFEMRLAIPSDVPGGLQPLGWRIVGGDYIDAETSTDVKVGPAGLTAPPTSLTATPMPSACTIDQLNVRLAFSGVAMGTWSAVIELTNRGTPCTMSGYPQVDGVTAAGRSTLAVHDSGYMNGLGVPGVPTFVLGSGERAGIDITGTDNPVQGSQCPPPYARFRVALPGSSASTNSEYVASAGISGPSCGGLRVSAIHPIRDFQTAGG